MLSMSADIEIRLVRISSEDGRGHRRQGSEEQGQEDIYANLVRLTVVPMLKYSSSIDALESCAVNVCSNCSALLTLYRMAIAIFRLK